MRSNTPICASNRTTDYVFAWDKMLAMEGNTATYMQYAYARCRSIFRKAGESPEPLRADPPPMQLADPNERALGLQLLRFEETLVAAGTDLLPHLITQLPMGPSKSLQRLLPALSGHRSADAGTST